MLAAMDASLHAAFAGAGLADAGLYTPHGADAAVDCSVYIDRNVQPVGEFGQMTAPRTEVVYVLGSMPVPPAEHGRLVADGDTLINVHEIENDGSLSRWVVRRG